MERAKHRFRVLWRWFPVALLLPSPALADDRALPQVPEGFRIAKVAGDPEVNFPMFAAFDDRGRLFVAESSGGDLYAELQQLEPRCRISALEDEDGDGIFETAAVFAEELVMPMGLAWHDGRLYVAEGPAMVALEDTDGDGRADRRTAILDGFGHSDNGSLHGTHFGPDGWLYMTIGQPDGFRFTDARGEVVESRIGALIRCRPDGSEPEVVTRGFENPVEIDFLPTGEIVGTANWIQLPATGLRDALVHHVEGGKYPRMEDAGTPQPRTGVELPALAVFPAVASSGLVRHRGAGFPEAWRGRIFSAQFNARRVQAHTLTRIGASFTSEEADFVTSENPDFHPSDVLQAPDGSLLVVDTGGWYVQHCPTGAIRASNAPGGIYRVWYPATPPPAEAAAELDAFWALPDDALRKKLAGEVADEAALAARILGRRKGAGLGADLGRLLAHPAAHVRMAAAEAHGACGDASSLPAIWKALAGESDPFLRHALAYAALRLADKAELRRAADSPEPQVGETARLLLDQPPSAEPTTTGPDPRDAPPLPPEATAPTAEQRSRLAAHGPALTGGNPQRGRELFFATATCSICHQVRGEGRAVGPDLTAIGLVRPRQAMLEAIVLPSATFAQRFEPFELEMADGGAKIGMVVDHDARGFLFRDAAGNEERLPRESVRSFKRIPHSLMPERLEALLGAEELRDLLAYLESLRG